ncbi:MAG TPA: hypothetical protein VF861_10910 [Telluria sp.]
MPSTQKILASACALLLTFAGGAAHADGLADLKAALVRLNSQAPIKGIIDLRTWQRPGNAPEPDQGQVALTIEDSPDGLRLTYSRDMLARIDADQRARARDPDVKTPTLAAVRSFDTADMLPMVSSATWLARLLDRAVFKAERGDAYAGKPARLLTFEIPLTSLSKRERKYAKRIESLLEIWTAADGTPLATRSTQTVFGRAFVVVSFEAQNEEENVFSVVHGRLVTLRKTSRSNASGAGERDERKAIKTLQVL